jgi:hypothetical protein
VICKEQLSFSFASRHIELCLDSFSTTRLSKGEPFPYAKSGDSKRISRHLDQFHISVWAENSVARYWLHLLLSEDFTLRNLDKFFRSIWLECCGHLSKFEIRGVNYFSSPFPDTEFDDRSMDVKLGDSSFLKAGDQLKYEYDFGTTTELELKVISRRKRRAMAGSELKSRSGQLILLARNDPPDIVCGKCRSRRAELVCPLCIWEENKGSWLCRECSKSHKCGVHHLRPIVNSPRVGLCGYTGEPLSLSSL